MRRPCGYAVLVDPDRPIWERDTVTCAHCARVVFIKPGTAATVYLIQHRDERWTEEPGASCYGCFKPICLACYRTGGCRPLERWLESQERSS